MKTLELESMESLTIARIDNNGDDAFSLTVFWVPDCNYTGLLDVTVSPSVTVQPSEKVFLNATFLIHKQGVYTGNVSYVLSGDGGNGNPINYAMCNKVVLSTAPVSTPISFSLHIAIGIVASLIVSNMILIVWRRKQWLK